MCPYKTGGFAYKKGSTLGRLARAFEERWSDKARAVNGPGAGEMP